MNMISRNLPRFSATIIFLSFWILVSVVAGNKELSGSIFNENMIVASELEADRTYGLPLPRRATLKTGGRRYSNLPFLKKINKLPKAVISFYPYLFRFVWI